VAWNSGVLQTLPADDTKLQGLNPTLAIIDEAEEVPLSVLAALEDRLGKRAEAVVLAIGTPGNTTDSALATVRDLVAGGADYRMTEYGAPLDADPYDPATWHQANPALAAGILGVEAIERDVGKLRAAKPHVQALLMRRFRMYRLGQWLQTAPADAWLPAGAWDDCRTVPPPEVGTAVVLGLDGTYRRSTAIVGADVGTGAIFLLWAGELADDHEVVEVMQRAIDRYNVVEVSYYPTIRPTLMAELDRRGLPMREWSTTPTEEARVTNALWQAIAEGTLAHDGSELLREHFENVGHRDGPKGTVLRRVHSEGRWIDAAMAARMAWARAQPWIRAEGVVY
jgi:phage terminase large subunit-like protein